MPFFSLSLFSQTLPLFTSLINIVFSYDPVGYLPYNYLLFTDTREPLVEVVAQLLCVTLDNSSHISNDQITTVGEDCPNLFINYLSRIHRDEVIFDRDLTVMNQRKLSSRILVFYWKVLVDYWIIHWFKRIYLVRVKKSVSIKNYWFSSGNFAIEIRFDFSIYLSFSFSSF